jgi:hypothetical protein
LVDLLKLLIRVDSAEVDKGARKLDIMSAAAHGADRAVAKLFSGVGKVVGAYVSWQMAERVVTKVVSSTIEAEDAQQRLATVIASTRGAAGLTVTELTKMAGALQSVTKYGDEAIMSAQGMLLPFERIGKEVFPDALEAVLNFSTKMGTDLQSASLLIGKALNDPIKGLTALSRAGVQFDAVEKATIKSMLAVNDVAGAQAIILGKLEEKFGGSARAARGTLGGALTALQEVFGDLFEVTGARSESLRISVEGLIGTFQDPEFVSAVQGFGGVILSMISTVAQAISATWGQLERFFNWLQQQNAAAEAEPALQARLEQEMARLEDLRAGKAAGDWTATEGAIRRAEQGIANLQARLLASRGGAVAGLAGVAGRVAPTATAPGGNDRFVLDDQIAASGKAERAYAKLIESSQQRVQSARLEAQTLGMTREEVARLTIEQELLNKAANDNIKLTPNQTSALKELASQIAETEEHTKRLKDAYDFGRSVMNGFFTDLKSNLREGKGLWGSFAAAGANALDRIADKALGMAADGIWDLIFGAIMGGIGGGATGGTWGNGLWGSAIFNAKGNTYSATSGLHRYVNTIVDRPTVFPFAKGGAVGVMGEAGKEAIMPLGRTTDGSLGVRVANNNSPAAANSNDVTVNVYNQNGSRVEVRKRKTSKGREMDVYILDVVRDGVRRGAVGF